MLNWTKDKETMELEGKIARRAMRTAGNLGVNYPMLDAVIDIDACHSNGCPLKLQELLDADDFNFAHDVFGIRQHIDRATGKLGDCFLPRYAQQAGGKG